MITPINSDAQFHPTKCYSRISTTLHKIHNYNNYNQNNKEKDYDIIIFSNILKYK